MIRAEGLTELVGDIVIQCTGGTPVPPGGPVPTADVRLSLNTPITNRIIADHTDTLLLVGEPGSPSGPAPSFCPSSPCAGNVYPGRISSPNSVIWEGIPIQPPSAGPFRYIRVTNVRVNANQLASPVPGAALPVQGSLQFGGTPFGRAIRLGTVGPDLPFRVRDPKTYQQCVSVPPASGRFVGLRYEEGFPSAFKARTRATASSADVAPSPAAQDTPGTIYNTESGFYNPALAPSSTLGLADHGTRLMARFNNVPAGVQVWVGTYESGATAANARVRLITTDPAGAGAFSPVSGAPEAGGQLAPISLSTGAGQAVWEVVKADPNALETISVDVAASYTANQASLGTAFVTPGFAPLSNVASMSATAPVPRFVLNNGGFGVPSPLFTIAPCTNAAPQIFTVFRTFNLNLEAGTFFPGVQDVSVTSTTTPLNLTATPSGGPWLSATLSSPITPTKLRIVANPDGLPAGAYSGTVNISAPGATNSPVSIAVNLRLAGEVPKINAVTNAATNQPGPLSPGMITVLYGERMGPPGLFPLAVDDQGFFLPIAGVTRVLMDGKYVPMVYASPTQVSAIAPYSLAGKTSTQVVVETLALNKRSLPVTVPVAAANPALFTANSSGTGPAAALNQDFSVNGPDNPAPAASFLFLFGTGEGQTDPPGQDGKITGSVLARPRLPVSVRFGNTTVTPDYAGAAPGLVAGVLQVNVRVPEGLTPGPVPVVLRVGDRESPAGVTVFVK